MEIDTLLWKRKGEIIVDKLSQITDFFFWLINFFKGERFVGKAANHIPVFFFVFFLFFLFFVREYQLLTAPNFV